MMGRGRARALRRPPQQECVKDVVKARLQKALILRISSCIQYKYYFCLLLNIYASSGYLSRRNGMELASSFSAVICLYTISSGSAALM